MLSFLIRRIFYALIMLVVVSFVSFVIISLPPGDFMTQKIRELEAMGDKMWVSNFVQGDFGLSFEYEQPVATLLKQRLPLSLTLAIATTSFTWLIAIPIGVFSAVKQYSLGDQIFTTLSFIGVGIPSFLLALVVLYIAIVKLDQDVIGLFSRDFQDAPWSLAKVWDLLKHMWVPAMIGAITGTAGTIRIMRGNLLDTLGQPFIEAARARGLKNRTVIWRHAVRMAINPLIVILGTETFPGILAGNILVEVVLSLPTMGPLYIRALLTQDMFTAGTVLVFITLMVLVGAVIADLALAWVDPRIRLE